MDQWVIAGTSLHVSAIAWAEYLCGPLSPTEEAATVTLKMTTSGETLNPISDAELIGGMLCPHPLAKLRNLIFLLGKLQFAVLG